MTTYMGITSHGHDASVALIRDHEILFAAHAERYSGIKNVPVLNSPLIVDCLRYGTPDKIVFFEQPLMKRARNLVAGQYSEALSLKTITQSIKEYDELKRLPILFSHHHESHAATGFYTSKFEDATIVVVDAVGEMDTVTIWEAVAGRPFRKLWSQQYPNSIALLYTAFTDRLKLKPNEEEYIMMGMSAYGNPTRFLQEILDEFFAKTLVDLPLRKITHNVHKGIKWWKQDQLTSTDYPDVAAAIQTIYTSYIKDLMCIAKRLGNSKNLVYCGGGALNCVTNAKIAQYGLFENIWIPPNPGDAGSAIGAIAAKTQAHVEWVSPFLGYNIRQPLDIHGIIKELKTGNPVGVANGRAEFGPRAFGNRSLLADPRNPLARDNVNRIKQRELFRPFAPAVLEEFAPAYFELLPGIDYRYMQYAVKCKVSAEYPGIVHIDNTSRVQVVPPTRSANDGVIRQILEAWYAETKCPMLLNTSLNIKGKPLVNNTADAIKFEREYRVKVF